MPKTKISPWLPERMLASPLFEPLLSYSSPLQEQDKWPDLTQFNSILFDKQSIVTGNGAMLHVVPQATKPLTFEERYAVRIYLKGELQTREENWHDYFQAVSWRMFPKTKVATNRLHFQAALTSFEQNKPAGARSTMENALSQFDECGVIILSDRPELLELIRRFDWHELFWRRREQLTQHLRCIVFGHAIYEKAISPYIGLTAKAVLFEVESGVMDLGTKDLVSHADTVCSHHFQPIPLLTTPRQLHPFPILGMPAYDPDNSNEAYYANRRYFRSPALQPET